MVRAMISAFVLGSALLAGVVSSPAQFSDGNNLHTLCEESPVAAASYAVGVLDAAYLYQQLIGVKDRICLPAGVTAEQVLDVACKYLVNKPEDRHTLAADLVAESAASAWPCP